MKIYRSILLLLVLIPGALFSMNQENFSDSSGLGLKRTADQAEIISEPGFDSDEQLLHDKVIVRLPRKKRRIDPQVCPQYDPVETVFTNPDILTNVFQQLHGPDFGRLACVSKACAVAAGLSSECIEKNVAHLLLQYEDTPIHYVLEAANGQESALICGITCNTQKLIAALQEKTSILDEAIVDFTTFDYLPAYYARKSIPVPPSIEQKLSHDELETVKPIACLEINFNDQLSEDQIAARVRYFAGERPNNLFVLGLFNKTAEPAGHITQSLIDKIAQYPIAALIVNCEQFPEGLGCLSALKQLRCLILEKCNLFDHTELPSEVCQKLPLLTVLSLIKCKITSIPPAIGSLRHLRVLEIENDALIGLPRELRNLNKLKILNIWKQGSLPPETIQCLPEMTGIKNLVLPNMGNDVNPIPESSNPAQLESLVLVNTIEPLKYNPARFKKLKILEMWINRPHFTLPPYIAELPALQLLVGKSLPDDAIIPYATLLSLAQNLTYCTVFGPDIDITKIRQFAHLWQLVQSNGDLILHHLDEYGELIKQKRCADFMKACAREIGTIHLLINPTITCQQLRDIIYGGSIDKCEQLIHLLLKDHEIQTGFQESQAIIKEFGKGNQEFATIFSMIASSLCSDVPVYSTVTKNKTRMVPNKSPYTFYSFQDLLRNFAFTVYQIMNDIEKGNVITKEQFRKCIGKLKMCSCSPGCIKCCAQQLIFLFTNHALRCKDTTNTSILFTYSTNIEQFIK